MAVSPSIWIDDPKMKRTKGLWPPDEWPEKGSRSVQLKKAVQNNIEADPTWPWHDVIVLHLYGKC